jgi:hypothetical protein
MAGPIVRELHGLAPARQLAAVAWAVADAFRPRASEGPLEIALPLGRAWSVDVRRGGAELRCLAGSVWLTCEGDLEDRVLEAGAIFRTERPGRVAVLALAPASVVVHGDVAPAARRDGRR